MSSAFHLLGLSCTCALLVGLGACKSSSDDTSTGGTGGAGTGGSEAGGGGAGGALPLELLHRAGRFDDSADPAGPLFSWSGSALGTRFDGTGIAVRLSGAPDVWFEIVLDGSSTGKFITTGGELSYPLASGLAAGPHDIAIERRNEGFFGDVQFLAFEPSGGALVPSPSPYRHRLEFIGDSITCGYGVEGADASCPFTGDTESAYLGYAAVAARALSASAHLVAYSGKGVFQNYNGDKIELMPELYGRTLTNEPTSVWDFARYTPEAVVVNLGSNDFATPITENDFVGAYVGLLGAVRSHYPAARIFCVSWSSWGATEQGYIGAAITQFGDSAVEEVPFVPNSADGFGCDSHPSIAMQAKLAGVVEAAIRARLGW